jgi:hypothetical protein
MEAKTNEVIEMPVQYFCKVCDSFQKIQKTELGGVAKDITMITLECGHELMQLP